VEKYLIRFGRGSGAVREVEVTLAGDLSAVRQGQRMIGPGEMLEVWRGDELIFRSQELGQVLRTARGFGVDERGARRIL
jgi:hypothetical protein